MDSLQEEFSTLILKFQEQFNNELRSLKEENERLSRDKEKVKCENVMLIKKNKTFDEICEIIKSGCDLMDTPSQLSNGCSACGEKAGKDEGDLEKASLPTDEPVLDTVASTGPVLHSVKDRLQSILSRTGLTYSHLEDPKTSSLSTVGKKMAAHFRKMNQGENPAKRPEKKKYFSKWGCTPYTSAVNVYGVSDWEYLDSLITNELNLGKKEEEPVRSFPSNAGDPHYFSFKKIQ